MDSSIKVSQFPRRSGHWFLSLIIFLATTCVPACATVAHSQNPIVDNYTLWHMEQVTGANWNAQGSRDLHLFIFAGGAYTRIIAYAAPSVPAHQVAVDLASAIQGTSLAGSTVNWSNDGHATLAEVSISRSRFGLTRSTSAIPLGLVDKVLKGKGYIVDPVLITPPHSTVTPSMPSTYASTDDVRYVGPPLAAVAMVRVSESVPSIIAPIVVSLLIGELVLAGIVMRRAWRTTFADGFEWKQRSAIWRRLAVWPMTVIGIAVGLVNWQVFSQVDPAALSDLWFGETYGQGFEGFLMIVSSIVFVASLSAITVAISFIKAPAVNESGAGHARDALIFAAILIVPLIGKSIVESVLGKQQAIRAEFVFIGLAFFVGFYLRVRLARRTRQTVDHHLTHRAQQIAGQLGTTIRAVHVDEQSGMRLIFVDRFGADGLTASRRAIQDLTENEMAFALAAAISSRHAVRAASYWIYAPLIIPLLTLIGGFFGGIGVLRVIQLLWLPTIVWIVIGAIFRKLRSDAMARQGLLDYDKIAVEFTQDPEAAMSTIDKMEAVLAKDPNPDRTLSGVQSLGQPGLYSDWAIAARSVSDIWTEGPLLRLYYAARRKRIVRAVNEFRRTN